VIALDADTLLLPGMAARLVGTIAHPLNRPRLGRDGRVSAGHAVIQPRCVRRPWGNTRLNLLLFPHAPQPFDAEPLPILQHILFGLGTFWGKGIYDVEAFERSIDGRFPENWILSHDKLEGMLARAGFATEIVLFESAPRQVASLLVRTHRWARGDYQILPWSLPWVPSARGWVRSPLPWLDRWRIVNDIVATLRFPSLLGLLLAAWFGLMPGGPVLWTLLALGKPLVKIACATVNPVTIAIVLVMLPATTWITLDAGVRALFRITPAGRHRALEWMTAAHGERVSDGWSMKVVVFAASIAALLAWHAPIALIPAAPLLVGWLMAPSIGRWLGQRPLGELPDESIDSFVTWCKANKRPIRSPDEELA
jgi:cyclic beta-1,2-glucan synthetase